jgi:Ca-activated chloride channel family protein
MLFLLVLVPAVAAVYQWSLRRRDRRIAALGAQGLATTGAGPQLGWRRHLPLVLFALALTLLVLATARPAATIVVPRRQATVIVAIDVSNSMAATDVRPSRIGAAKTVADAFVRRQPPGVRIGVVAFGQGSVIVQRPTSTHADVLQAINHLSLGGGTSLAQGILTSLDAIAGRTLKVNVASLGSDSAQVHIGYYGGATIVLLSDGENTSQTGPEPLARLASVAGVRIQTMGIGTAAGTTVKISGFTVATALDSQTLKAIATVTNGAYHQADVASGLRAVSGTIDLHFTIVHSHTEITAIFAAGAALVLVAGALISIRWFGRVV